jgi:hypothetical protein
MPDEKKPEEAAEPDHFQEHLKGAHPQAKKGVTETGIVSSAGGELIDGRIADITDGDRPRRK